MPQSKTDRLKALRAELTGHKAEQGRLLLRARNTRLSERSKELALAAAQAEQQHVARVEGLIRETERAADDATF